jgi:cell division protein FtsI/penicillin-binding protein 2
VLPFIIAQDLRFGEVESFRRAKADNLVLQPVYQRHYPNGQLAGHIIGYAGPRWADAGWADRKQRIALA